MADITYFEDGDDLYLCFHNCKANAETLKNVLLAIGAAAAAPLTAEPVKHTDNTEAQKVVEAKKEERKQEEKASQAEKKQQENKVDFRSIRSKHDAIRSMMGLLDGKEPRDFATTPEKREELKKVYELFVYYGGKRNNSTEKAIWPNGSRDQINKTVEEIRNRVKHP